MYSRKWKQIYPVVPSTEWTEARWSIEGVGTLRIERGTPQRLRTADAEWVGLPEELDDDSSGWHFEDLGKWHLERYMVTAEDGRTIAGWIDHDHLVSGDAYRVDFLKVRPDLQGRGIGKIVLGLIALRARELTARRVVFQPLKRAEPFFFSPSIGAQKCWDWKGGEALPNLELQDAALQRLVEHVTQFKI